MAKRLVFATLFVSSLLGIAKAAEAQSLDDVTVDTVVAAKEANVSVPDLLGAMAATGLPGRDYLIGVGELATPKPLLPLGPPYGNAVAQAKCIIGKESGGLDIPNRSHSGADGPGQYFVATWARHTAVYRSVTGYLGPLSLHVYDHVLAVMSVVLPRARAEWSVGGC